MLKKQIICSYASVNNFYLMTTQLSYRAHTLHASPISYLGSVRMRPSLEVDDPVGVTRAGFCVFLHRPLLGRRRRHAGVLTQLHVRVLGGQAGREANVLPHQPPAAAPGEESTFICSTPRQKKKIPAKTRRKLYVFIKHNGVTGGWVNSRFIIITVLLHVKVKEVQTLEFSHS